MCVQEVLRPLVSVDPNQVGDLHLDVAEALMDVGLYAEARPILDGLVHSHEYNKVLCLILHSFCEIINWYCFSQATNNMYLTANYITEKKKESFVWLKFCMICICQAFVQINRHNCKHFHE
jgi:hypothetical protein